jgi:AraC-like DNA-binding protein
MRIWWTASDETANWKLVVLRVSEIASWIDFAQKLLSDGLPVATAAREMGYRSPKTFAKTFRLRMGCSASEWIRDHTNMIASGKPEPEQ